MELGNQTDRKDQMTADEGMAVSQRNKAAHMILRYDVMLLVTVALLAYVI